NAFAMEATTTECASFIDRGFEDYMLETAMLKVWSTEALWAIVNDTLQIHGGQGYFTRDPYERWMRDARINMIGEGANEVLKAFRKKALAHTNGTDNEELRIMEVVYRSQYLQERLSDAACDLYASSCTLARLDHLLGNGGEKRDLQAGRYFLVLANRRIKQ